MMSASKNKQAVSLLTIEMPPMPADLGELPEVPELITISLAAETLGFSRQAVHKMVRTGRLKAWRLRSAGNDRPLVVRESEVLAMRTVESEVIPGPSSEG